MRYAGRRVPVVLGLAMVLGVCSHGPAFASAPGGCVKYAEGASADALVYHGDGRVSIRGVASGATSSDGASSGPGYEISATPMDAGCVRPPCRIESFDGTPDPGSVFCPSRASAPQTVRVLTGDGPDAVDLWDAVRADVAVQTHGGDDRVALDYYIPGGVGAGSVAVTTGAGDDAFTVGLCERLYYRNVSAAMGPGADTVFLGRGEGTLGTGCLASIDGDGGDDAITTWSVGTVSGGGGDDTIRSFGTNLGRGNQTFEYDGGPGADTLVDATRSFPWFAGATPVRLRGGAGRDVIDGGGSPLFDPGSADPGAFGIPDDIDCGAGRDTVVVYPRDTLTGC